MTSKLYKIGIEHALASKAKTPEDLKAELIKIAIRDRDAVKEALERFYGPFADRKFGRLKVYRQTRAADDWATQAIKEGMAKAIFNMPLPDGRKLGDIWNHEWSTYQREHAQFAAMFGWLIQKYGATNESMKTKDIAKPALLASEWGRIQGKKAA